MLRKKIVLGKTTLELKVYSGNLKEIVVYSLNGSTTIDVNDFNKENLILALETSKKREKEIDDMIMHIKSINNLILLIKREMK